MSFQQANEQAAQDAKVAQSICSLASAVSVGHFFVLGVGMLQAGTMLREMADLVRPFASVSTGRALTGAVVPSAPTADPSTRATHPLLIQAKTFEHERALYRNVLALSASALETFGPLIDLARKSEHERSLDSGKLAALG